MTTCYNFLIRFCQRFLSSAKAYNYKLIPSTASEVTMQLPIWKGTLRIHELVCGKETS